MIFPKDNDKLNEIFTNGLEPSPEEFVDEYWVRMLTGMLPNVRWAGHRKRFFIENENCVGFNLILLNNQFGYFKVETGECEDLNNLKAVILNYGEKRNFLTRSVRDKIRKIDDGVYLGRYYTVIGGGYQFKGYFSLERK